MVSVRGDAQPPRALIQLYYMAFLIGFAISAVIFYILNMIFPVQSMDQIDDVDLYDTFTKPEARRIEVLPLEQSERESKDNVRFADENRS